MSAVSPSFHEGQAGIPDRRRGFPSRVSLPSAAGRYLVSRVGTGRERSRCHARARASEPDLARASAGEDRSVQKTLKAREGESRTLARLSIVASSSPWPGRT